MRFKIIFKTVRDQQRLLFNYQYCLQAWIYKLLDQGDARYAAFLHGNGYIAAGRRKPFKHFNFSSLIIPRMYKPRPGDMFIRLRSQEIGLVVSFYIDQAAESFIVGLFQNQKLSLYNKKYKADFIVEKVEVIPTPIPENHIATLRLQTLSPMVIAERVDNIDQYLTPQDDKFAMLLAYNLVEKYLSLQPEEDFVVNIDAVEKLIKFKLLPDQIIKKKGMIVKEGNLMMQTKVIGYYNFQFELTAPREILKVALLSGIGRYSSTLGCGCCEVL